MWIKLGSEHLNLDHVVRVRFNKGWKNGQEELVAEVESYVKGDIQVFARYRSRDAEVLYAALQAPTTRPRQTVLPEVIPLPVTVPAGLHSEALVLSHATNTLHDI